MVSPDTLLAEIRRVLDALAPPQEAARLLERLELSLGNRHPGNARDLVELLVPYIEQAFPDESARERLLEPLELALFERRYGEYGLLCTRDAPPRGWEGWRAKAAHLFEEPGAGPPQRAWYAVRRGWGEPHFLATREFPEWNPFFDGLIIPETGRLFAGAGRWVAVYALDAPAEPLLHDVLLFWSMERHGDGVLVVAEISVALFDLRGHERWAAFADPPHDVTVEGDEVVIFEQLSSTTKRIRLRDGSLVS